MQAAAAASTASVQPGATPVSLPAAPAPSQPADGGDLAEQEQRAVILGREHAETRRRPLNRDRAELTKLFTELAWDGSVSEERLLHLQAVYAQAFKLAGVESEAPAYSSAAPAAPPAAPAQPSAAPAAPPPAPDEPPPAPPGMLWNPMQRHHLIEQIEALANEERHQPGDHSVYHGPDGKELVAFAGHERSCAVRLSSGEIFGPFMGCGRSVEIALEYIAEALGIEDRFASVEPLRTGALAKARAGEAGPARLFAPAVPSEVEQGERILGDYLRVTPVPSTAAREELDQQALDFATKAGQRRTWLEELRQERDSHKEGTRVYAAADKKLATAKATDDQENTREQPILEKRRRARWEDLVKSAEADLATRLGAYAKLRPGSRHFELARAAARRVAVAQGVPEPSVDFVAGQAALYVYEHPGLEDLAQRVRLEAERLQAQAAKVEFRAALQELELPHHQRARFEERLAGLPLSKFPELLAEATAEAHKYAPVVDPAAVPAAPPLEAYSAPAPALRWPALCTSPPLAESDYVPTKSTDLPLDPPLLNRYDQGRGFQTASTLAPSDDHQGSGPTDMSRYPFVVGAWRMVPRGEVGRGIHGAGPIERLDGGRIEQLRVLTPQILEQVRVPNDCVVREGKVARYADWMRQGHVPPPVVVKTLHDGTLEIIEGGSRWRAALVAEKPLLGWVGDAVRTGVKPWGEVQFTGLTFDLVNPEAILSAVRGRDRGDPRDQPAFERADEVLRIRRGWLPDGDLAYLASLDPAPFRAVWTERKKAVQVGLAVAPVPGVFSGPLEALHRLEKSMKGRAMQDPQHRSVTFRYTDLNGNELDITGVSGEEVLQVHLVTPGPSADGSPDTEPEAVLALHQHEWPQVLEALDRALDLDSEP